MQVLRGPLKGYRLEGKKTKNGGKNIKARGGTLWGETGNFRKDIIKQIRPERGHRGGGGLKQWTTNTERRKKRPNKFPSVGVGKGKRGGNGWFPRIKQGGGTRESRVTGPDLLIKERLKNCSEIYYV